MGFDNECVLNIQSLAGEYFCPVCRLLVYPNEALVSQCTHLYCKPCLAYIVSTTQACPYDGYLVTEADSKPLVEANKALAETIGKTTVHCLYHRSGCAWQGPLSECTSHCSGCAYGNSPVVCNRCAIQIVHRQVQEHAQNCPGVQPQAQQVEGAKDASATNAGAVSNQTQTASQAGTITSQVQTQTGATPTVGKDSNQPATNSQAQGVVQPAAPTAEQWYQQQQQYQQYYQQYPGYNPYQQQYQQYYLSQQQTVPHQQQHHLQAQPQGYVQPQSQPQTQVPSQLQAQPQVQPQSQLQPPHPPVQAPLAAGPQNQAPVNPQSQTHPLPQGHPLPQPQSYPHAQPQPQSYPPQPHAQYMQMPQYQQPHSQMQYLQSQNQHTIPQPLPQAYPQAQVQTQTQTQPFSQLNPPQPNQPHTQQTASHAVTGHHSYQQQTHQQISVSGSSHASMHVHPQTGAHPPQNPPSQQPPLMCPPQTLATFPNHQQPALLPLQGQVPNMRPAQEPPVHPHAPPPHLRPVSQPVQQPMPQSYVQHQQPFVGQHQLGPFGQQQLPMQSHLRSQGLPQTYQQNPHAYPQPQQNVALAQGLKPPQLQNLGGRPVVLDHGVQSQPNPSAAGMPGRVVEPGANQPSSIQNSALVTSDQVQLPSEHQLGATLRPMMPQKQDITGREAELSQCKDAVSGPQEDAVGMKIKYETDEKHMMNKIKTEAEDNSDAVHISAKKFVADLDSQAAKSGDAVIKQGVKEEVPENGEGQKNLANVDRKSVDHSVSRDKEIQDGPVMKIPQFKEAAQLGEQDGMRQKDKMLPQFNRAPQGPGAVPLVGHDQSGRLLQSPQNQYASSILQLRPAAPSVVHGGRPDSHLPGSLERGPHVQPPGIQSNTMRRNGPPVPGFQDERFKAFPDDNTNPFTDQSRHGIGRGEFEDPKQFPRPFQFDTVPGPKLGCQFPSSRHLDKDLHSFGMDAGPRPYDRGLNYDPLLKMDNTVGAVPFKHRPSYATDRPGGHNEDALGRSDFGRPDFHGPLPGYGRHDMDRLGPRSPIKEYSRISSRGFAEIPGNFGRSSLDDVDGVGFNRYGDPVGNSFQETKFPRSLRGEFEGPGRGGDLIGRDFLPSHLRRAEHLGPHNLRWGEAGGLSGFPEQAHIGDFMGPGNFSHSRLDEPGFRSSFTHQNFPNDGGFYTGDIESFEHSRKRKPISMGWCRICKIDCETVDGLDLHSQTREHQKMAMDMVVVIKQNAKKQKINSGDRAPHEDASKSRRATAEDRGKKH